MGYTKSVQTEEAHQFEYTFLSCLRTDGSYRWEETHLQDDYTKIGQGNYTIDKAFEMAVDSFRNDEGEIINEAASIALLLCDESDNAIS